MPDELTKSVCQGRLCVLCGLGSGVAGDQMDRWWFYGVFPADVCSSEKNS